MVLTEPSARIRAPLPYYGSVTAISVQQDAKIVIGGAFTNFSGTPCKHVARLTSDGALDLSFDTSDGPDGDVKSLAIQPDGRVVIGGAFSTVNGLARPGIARLNGNIEPGVPPNLVSQPQDREVARGMDVIFSVKVTGTIPLVYQWFRDGTAIAGASDSTLNLTNIQAADAGAYSVVVTNLAGSATGGPAALVVDGTPVIVGQPVDQSAIAGESVTFSMDAYGPGPLSYQWSHAGQRLADRAGVNGSSTAKLTLAKVEFADEGKYSVRVFNPFGSTLSRTAKLLVIPANDQFAASTALGTLGDRVFGDNQSASKDAGEPDHAGNRGGRSVWFSWTAGAGGRVVVDTLGSSFDTLLAVYRGTDVVSLTVVAANDDGVGQEGNSRVSSARGKGKPT